MELIAGIIAFIVVACLVYIHDKKEEVPIEKKEMPSLILTPKLTESYLTFDNFVGQKSMIQYLRGYINVAKKEQSALPHTILWGPGGLGKSTLMKAVAQEMGGRFIELVPANLRTSKELHGILFNKSCNSCLHPNPFNSRKCYFCGENISDEFEPEVKLQDLDIIFLEECHGLKQDIEEALYSLMQDSYLMMRYGGIDQRVEFPAITIAGATTQLGDLRKPFRDRFPVSVRLVPYDINDMRIIIKTYCKHKELIIESEAINRLAKISHGTPRVAKKRVSDTAILSSTITTGTIDQMLSMLSIDKNGLEDIHRDVINYILIRMQSVKNGGAGAAAIASSVGIPTGVYLEIYEPPLLYHGYIFMGSKGRRLTEKAMKMYCPNSIGTIK